MVSWFGDIASVAHAASCSVSTLCGSLGSRTGVTTVDEGDIITCKVGDKTYQDKKCFGSGGIIVTPIYSEIKENSTGYVTVTIDQSQFSVEPDGTFIYTACGG